MSHFAVHVIATGWFPVEADTIEDAERAASDAVKHGVPFDVDWDDCEWDAVEPDE